MDWFYYCRAIFHLCLHLCE